MVKIALRLLGFVFACSSVLAASDLDQDIVLAPHDGTAAEDFEIRRWQERARAADATADVFERLGWAYVAKARRTLDAGFYTLAGKAAEVVDTRFGARVESQLLRGHVLHNVHRFREAELVARQLVAERGTPTDLGLLSDALVEQGKLVEGAAVLQRMVDAKPSTEAFARVAHVRWLKGDLAGAAEAMETAFRSSDARDEATRAWLLTRLSGLHLQRGNAPLALRLAEAACQRAALYPPAMLAQGRALIALDRIADALVPLRRAAELQPLPEYQWWLAEAYAAAGNYKHASKLEQQLKARGAVGDARTYALFLATRGEDLVKAVKLARAELNERADVFSHDALAWAMAATGDLQGADEQMRLALAEGTNDARLFLHAGEIALARGERDVAEKHFAGAFVAAATLTPSERALLTRRISTSTDVAAK